MSRQRICRVIKPAWEIPTATESMTLAEIVEIVKLKAPSWQNVFDKSKPEITKIAGLLEEDCKRNGPYIPGKVRLFRAFEFTPLDKVRVVILGQDPYPTILCDGTPRAMGLSFSVAPHDEIPGSLRNIFKEIKMEYPEWQQPISGDLSGWAQQGVLMLNSCLTCPPNAPGGHSKYMLWMPFIIKVLKAISEVRPDCIFLMWGAESQKLLPFIGDKSIKLTAAHPSQQSCAKFFGCRHFVRVNDILLSKGEEPIRW